MRVSRLVLAGIVTGYLAGLVWRPTEAAPTDARHSGTVITVDRTGGTLTVEELGPGTVVVRRTFRVTPDTRFVLVRRSPGGDSGWPGGYAERPLEPWAVNPGDFVTVVTDDRATARAVVVVPPGQ